MRDAFPADRLRAAITAATSQTNAVTKAEAASAELAQAAARAALEAGVTIAEFERILREVFADAYTTGGHVAAEQLPGAAVTLAGIGDIDWDSWEPGDPDAAALLDDGGFADLLDSLDITINGIVGTTLDRLGNAIADGVAAGDSVDSIAGTLASIISDPDRAEMITHTETARAMTAATMNTYTANGIAEWDLVLSEGACEQVCVPFAAANPHNVGDDQPPLHPRCRCAAAPRASSVAVDVAGG